MRDYLNPRTLANQKLSTPRYSFTRVEGASQPYCPKWGALEQVHPHYLERDPCLSHPPEGVKAMRHERLFECLDLGQLEFIIFLYWGPVDITLSVANVQVGCENRKGPY